jgi:ADP-ribose pyrophosphatase
VASAVTHLGSIFSSPGFTDERIELFLARDVEPDGRPIEEGVHTVVMSFEDALLAIDAGRILDAKSVTGLLLARERTG